ncbi:MAG: hypothetical protein M3440_12265, partial [Chloroflexota bacterium]|nr:hypothetical protein [Chloroflexota bacterium]
LAVPSAMYIPSLVVLLATVWAFGWTRHRRLPFPAPGRQHQRRNRRVSHHHQARHLALAVFLCGMLVVGASRDAMGHDEGTPGSASDGSEGATNQTPQLDAEIGALPPAPAFIELSRITLEPGAVVELIVPGPEVYVVESGALGIRVSGEATVSRRVANDGTRSPEIAAPGVDNTLRAGDQIVVAGETQHTLMNDGLELTRVLSLVIFPAAFAVPERLRDAQSPPGTRIDTILSEVIDKPSPLLSGAVRMTVQGLELSSDETFALPDDAGFTMVMLTMGLATIVSGDEEISVGAGQAVQLDSGQASVIHNEGEDSLIATILMIVPVESGNRSATPQSSPMAG